MPRVIFDTQYMYQLANFQVDSCSSNFNRMLRDIDTIERELSAFNHGQITEDRKEPRRLNCLTISRGRLQIQLYHKIAVPLALLSL